MALLTEIRKRVWILISLIALSLILFIIPDSVWTGSFNSDPNDYGSINGEKITRQDVELRANMQQSRGGQVDYEQAWRQTLTDKAINQHFEKAGLYLPDDTFWHFAPFTSAFSQSQNLDIKKIKSEVQALEEAAATNPQMRESYNGWLMQRQMMENEIKRFIYINLINSTVQFNKKEIEVTKRFRTQMSEVDFVRIDYETYAQKKKYKISDEEIKEYIAKFPKKFKRPANVSLHYVVFNNEPTAKDDSTTMKSLRLLLSGGVIKDPETNAIDSVKSFSKVTEDELASYLDDHSDVPYNNTYQGINNQIPNTKDFLKTASIGSVYGPYTYQNYFIASKLVDKKPSDSTQSKHILFGFKGSDISKNDPTITRTESQAKKLADSVAAIVRSNPEKIRELQTLSDDKVSAQQGGDLGWTTPENKRFVKEFQDFVDTKPKGEVGVVKTQFGYHVILISDKKSGSPMYKVAHLAKERKPSKETEDKLYRQASEFIEKVKGGTLKNFADLANKKRYAYFEQFSVGRFASYLDGLKPNSNKEDEILKWAFNKKTNVGDVEMFSTSNGDHIVVYVSEKNDAGLASPKSVRAEVEPKVRNEKAAKDIISSISNGSSLEKIAKQFGVQVQSGEIGIDNPVLPGAGREPVVAGVATALKKGVTSSPIQGETGVYVIKVKNVKKMPLISTPDMLKNEAKQNIRGKLNMIFNNNIEHINDVEDRRIEANQ